MYERKKIFILIFIFSLFSIENLYGDLYENSIFGKAREQVSRLDLELAKIELRWAFNMYPAPSDWFKKHYPLLSKAQVGLNLSYQAYKDGKIEATGIIGDIEAFKSLEIEQRKKILSDLLDALVSMISTSIYNQWSGELDWQQNFEKKHINLTIIFAGYAPIQHPRLPFNNLGLGYGAAGYMDGQYVYSQNVYLDMGEEKSKARDRSNVKFIIESE